MKTRLASLTATISSLSLLTACGGGGGPSSDPINLRAPEVTVNAPATATIDTAFTLGWSSAYADSCVADFDNLITDTSASLSKTENTLGAKTYSVTCTNATASTTASATVEIVDRARAAGLWQGSTSDSRALSGVVRHDGAYSFVYSDSSAPAAVDAANIAGFVAASDGVEDMSATPASFLSLDYREFNFAGAGASRGSLRAGVENKQKFGLALSGPGAGVLSSTALTALPTTLTSSATDAALPLPGMAVFDVSGTTTISGSLGPVPLTGNGTSSGRALLKNDSGSTTFASSTRGPAITYINGSTPISDITFTQNNTFTGSNSISGGQGATFTVTGGAFTASNCVENNPSTPASCAYTLPSTFVSASGSVNTIAGGSITAYFQPNGNNNTTVYQYTPATINYSPAAPTFGDGNIPWTISASGSLALSGQLAFAPYTAALDLGNGVTATLSINQRQLIVNPTSAVPTYDSGAQQLRLTGATITDVSGAIGCSGAAAICGGSSTLASTTTPLNGDVVVDIDWGSVGHYRARVFVGGETSPVSVLTFEGELSNTPTVETQFQTLYSALYENAPTLAGIARAYTGSAGVETAIVNNVGFTIDANGQLAGGSAGGCTYSGSLVPAAQGNAYDVDLNFTSGGGCSYSGAFAGTAFVDTNGKLNITALNAARDKGFLFIEN